MRTQPLPRTSTVSAAHGPAAESRARLNPPQFRLHPRSLPRTAGGDGRETTPGNGRRGKGRDTPHGVTFYTPTFHSHSLPSHSLTFHSPTSLSPSPPVHCLTLSPSHHSFTHSLTFHSLTSHSLAFHVPLSLTSHFSPSHFSRTNFSLPLTHLQRHVPPTRATVAAAAIDPTEHSVDCGDVRETAAVSAAKAPRRRFRGFRGRRSAVATREWRRGGGREVVRERKSKENAAGARIRRGNAKNLRFTLLKSRKRNAVEIRR